LHKEDLGKQHTHPHLKPRMARRYVYDKVGELRGIEDIRKGNFSYSYDTLGRVTHAKTPSLEETFAFDPAHNLIEEDGLAIHNNRIETYQDKRYTYDAFGNMETKKISNHTQMTFSYNLEHQMIQAKVNKNNLTQNYTYGYDPFGRRVSKTDAFGTTYFTWDGNRLLCEKRNNKVQTYIYEQEGFVPVATLDEENTISYYHTDHLGTPQEMTNLEGDIVWEAEYSTWGNTAKVSYKQVDATMQEEIAFQPLRFQGQYYDTETGLHYNRFRYYDPDVGRFTTKDPIGLLGGDNLYAYAPNPVGWVDPLGLSNCPITSRPNQIHHYATNKSKKYTQKMEEIAKKFGLSLDGAWNKESLPHQGRHPYAYHDFVLEGMKNAARESGGCADKFKELFEKYVKKPVRDNPDLLRKKGWE